VSDTYKWADQTLNNLLDIKHHHIVMTLPKPLRHICNLNQSLIYNLLFKLSSKTLQDWFLHKHNIIPGIVSVLHTAGSDLKHHPHVHMIVSAGGLDSLSLKHKKLKGYFLTRQRFLANKLREAFIDQLTRLHKNNKLILPAKWNDSNFKFNLWLKDISDKQWIVSIQKPLNDLNQIVGYVGRYTKRACISEYKILSIDNDYISFKFNDYKNTTRGQAPLQSIRKLHFNKFFDLLLQHVPDKNFRMVRYYGCYASNYKKHLPRHNIQSQNIDHIQIDHSWGEYEELRKKDIINGKPDPLNCPNCNAQLDFDKMYFHQTPKVDDAKSVIQNNLFHIFLNQVHLTVLRKFHILLLK